MSHNLLLARILVGISGAAALAACGSSDDTAGQGQTSPTTGGAGGAAAGSGGATAGAAGTTAGAGGTTAGAGGTTAGSAGTGGQMAGAAGTSMAGQGGSKGGAGGASGGAGGMKGGAGGATAGTGGTTAGAGGFGGAKGCMPGGDCVLGAWCSTSTAVESYCQCTGAGAYTCGTPPVPFSNVTVCIDPDANGCPPLGDGTLSARINGEYVSMSCGAFAQTAPETKSTTAGVARCCYGVITDACVGRPLFVGERLSVAQVARRADWT